MTKTLTTEQLQDIYEAAVREEATGNPDESGEEAFDLLYLLDSTGGTGATIRKLIDLVRAANREAQPVGFYTTVSGRKGVVWHNGAPEDDTAIYTAPPAPTVTDEKAITPFFDTLALDTAKMVMCDVNRRSDFLGGDIQLLARIQCRVDDACRAAMLAQPVSQGYKLVPVEPTEDMQIAAREWSRRKYGRPIGSDASIGCYRAMLAKSPEVGK